jgi:hypothetical protein
MTTQVQSGTQTATLTTRHQLGTSITSAGNYVLVVDTNALVNGEELLLEAEIKTLNGSTSRVTETARFSHAQAAPVKRSVPIPVAHEVSFFLTQTGGTGRAFPWSILSL